MLKAMKKTSDDEDSDEDYDEDDYDDEDADTWDDEGSEEESGDSDGDWDAEGDDMQLIRVAHGGKNRVANVGYHTIEIYYPQFYLKQTEMEEWDADPTRYGPSVIGKYTKGVGQIEARYPTDDEDPVSYAMTVVHRLLERIERDGMNETSRYSLDGKPINIWNCIGRLDIGSESLIDRSKSMKAYVMDIFERYGDQSEGLGNIEGVDMYNACYGGQAAHLAVLGWLESDRWDGRYGICLPTDISDAVQGFMFCVGAAAAAGLLYPDAPLAHYSHRVSCILHRFDFFKPVGWYSMGPVVDGKYSINAYMECIDVCYANLQKKMNGRKLLEISDYNVFHTGGGWHVIKKAFDRVLRNDNPKIPAQERATMQDAKLVPGTHVTKIVGPCHTVSSFLNTASLCMTEWDRAIGKVLIVFTYGSGCASSMYQMLFNDIPWFDPLPVWKMKFYQDAIHMHAGAALHDIYTEVWMKFDYRPTGRFDFKFPIRLLQEDVYYLMEIDPWGRRFYHRGGLKTGELEKKYQMRVDMEETRGMRRKYGFMPEDRDDESPFEQPLWVGKGSRLDFSAPADVTTKSNTLEDKWKEIEFEMTYDPQIDTGKATLNEECWFKNNPEQKICIQLDSQPSKAHLSLENDNSPHTYQVIGSWTNMKEAEEMTKNADGSFTFEITLGRRLWHKFYFIQDGNYEKKVVPVAADSHKDNPSIGPAAEIVQSDEPKCWLLDGRCVDWVADKDVGEPGSRYRITFTWKNAKSVTWTKLPGIDRNFIESSRYSIVGSWTNWECEPMIQGTSKGGCEVFTLDVEKKKPNLEFQIRCNDDENMIICPNMLKKGVKGVSGCQVQGPVDSKNGKDQNWEIDAKQGDTFRITLSMPSSFEDDIEVTWEKQG